MVHIIIVACGNIGTLRLQFIYHMPSLFKQRQRCAYAYPSVSPITIDVTLALEPSQRPVRPHMYLGIAEPISKSAWYASASSESSSTERFASDAAYSCDLSSG